MIGDDLVPIAALENWLAVRTIAGDYRQLHDLEVGGLGVLDRIREKPEF